ncbi:MAG: hypothetical protein AAGP08_07690 [Pseudomonadota bacterium]
MTDVGPWAPGLSSTIPARLMPRVTLFDPAHAEVPWDEAKALSDGIGLAPHELAVLRPERLALHSVLIRVTSMLTVPDGPNYADLGLNLRGMAHAIFDRFVQPEMGRVQRAYEDVRRDAQAEITRLLDAEIYPAPPPPPPKGLAAWFRKAPEPPRRDPQAEALRIASEWADVRNETVPAACQRALARTLGAALKQRAVLPGRDVLERVALGLVLSRMGSAAVGQVVEALFPAAAEALGYRMLPAQSEPVVLNAKGASASGKSTIRDKQKQIAARLGLDWADFAVISPDYWRKALIDYEGLGDDYKYAAMLCGQELEVIDRKLDILMAVKGADGTVPHLLIDRFRFDSFARDRVRAEDSTLLTRFGAKIYLFFMITPPAETVVRAWTRGQATGRYKAVDDLLFHNIEAYAGMPDLFFSWAGLTDRWIHYEFLDNSVPLGETPRTVAYGQNGHLVIADLERFCDIERFRHVDVDAKRAEDVLDRVLTDQEAMAIVRRACRDLPAVDLLVPGSDGVWAAARDGELTIDRAALPAGMEVEAFGPARIADKPLGDVDADLRQETIGDSQQ